MEISWLVSKKFEDLIQNNPSVNRIFLFSKNFIENLDLCKKLSKENFDYILELQGLLKTSLIARFIAGNKKKVHGVLPARESFAKFFWDFKHDHEHSKKKHVIYKNLSVLKAFSSRFSVENLVLNKRDFGLPVEYKDPELKNKKYLVLAPSTTWRTKHWVDRNWILLSQKILDKLPEYNLIWLGDSSHPLANFKFQNLKVQNQMGQTSLLEAIKIISKAELLIGLDSGLTHVACAFGVKAIAIFGPTDQERNGILKELNLKSQNIYLEKKDLLCRPCYKKVCFLKKNNMKYTCLKQISVEEVFDTIIFSLSV